MRVAIRRIEGVEAVEVSLNQGVAVIRFAADNRVTVRQVRQAIRANGFTPKDAEIRVIGTVTEQEGHPVLAVAGQNLRYALSDHPEVQGVVSDMASRFMGRRVTIEGNAPQTTRGDEGPLTLEVRRFSLQ